MKLQTGQKNIKLLGQNLIDRYGGIDFVDKPTTVFTKQLEGRMTPSEIIKTYNPSVMELGEIYHLLDTLSVDSQYLFLVNDKEGLQRFIMAFNEPTNKDGWRLVSPTEFENPTWDKDKLLVSKTKI